jgi:hypothetical protein
MAKLFFVILSITFAQTTLVNAKDYQVYKVKKGDTISELLRTRVLGPLYVKEGILEKGLQTNRITKKEAKKLKVGRYLILPTKPEYITDSTSTSLSGNSKQGILTSKISHHQNIEFGASYFNKQLTLPKGGNISISQNLVAEFKVIGNSEGKPTISTALENSTGIYIQNRSSQLVELKPAFEIQSSYHLLESDRLDMGLLLNVNEESNVSYRTNQYDVRRDQYLWLGVQAESIIYIKKFELDLHGEIKKIFVSNSLTSTESLDLTRAELLARVNLTKDYYLSTFANLEFGDRTARSLGLGFTYKL